MSTRLSIKGASRILCNSSSKFKPATSSCSKWACNFVSQRTAAGHPNRNIQMSFSAFSRSMPFQETITAKVPTMGDSITEGTIVEWTVQIGQAVKEGDVVALVETDKVTVDIKAELDGVIISQYGAVDDTVEVGANLYQIDTEATADETLTTTATTITPSDTVSDTPPSETVATVATASASTTTASASALEEETGRVPSIHFLGKEGWKKKRESMPTTANATTVNTFSEESIVMPLDPMYGRPVVTEEEMETLILGGANLAPEY